jgi:hypothetical protein
MKHPASRTLYARWQAARLRTAAPAAGASDVSPRIARYRLTIAAATGGFALREAGLSFRALIGANAVGQPFAALFVPASRSAVLDLLTIAADEALPTVAGIAARRGRCTVAVELLVLPPLPAQEDLSGLMAPLTPGRAAALTGLTLTSWRHLHSPPPPPSVPRTLRKRAVAPGMVLYEGLR